MSDIDLPLWNRDETAVLVPYQSSYGHVQLNADVNRLCAVVRGLFRLGKLIQDGPFQGTDLPVLPKTTVRSLYDFDTVHLLVRRTPYGASLYAPHFLFFNSRRWMVVNWCVGGSMVYVSQLDHEEFSFDIFRRGKHRCLAFAFKGELSLPPETDFKFVSWNKIHLFQREPKEPNEREWEMIRSTRVFFSREGEQVGFIAPTPSPESVELSECRHLVYRPRSDWWKNNYPHAFAAATHGGAKGAR